MFKQKFYFLCLNQTNKKSKKSNATLTNQVKKNLISTLRFFVLPYASLQLMTAGSLDYCLADCHFKYTTSFFSIIRSIHFCLDYNTT